MRFDSKIQWPNSGRCAFLVTADVDAEYFWLTMEPKSKDWPNVLSIGAYGPNRGIPRLLEVLDRYRIPATFFVPGKVMEQYRDAMQPVIDRGHEIAHHGWVHEDMGPLGRDGQREVFLRGSDAIERATGKRPVGYRTAWGTMNRDTLELLVELGFGWSSSMRGDDRPYFMEIDERPTELIEIPIRLELEDFSHFMFHDRPAFPPGEGRIASFEHVYDIWRSEFDGFYKYGLCYVLILHPQTIGTPGRIRLLERLLDYAIARPGVWFATGSQVAEFWRRSGRANDTIR